MAAAPVLDLESPGKRSTVLEVATGKDGAPIRVPVTVVRRGEGPALLLTGGNHGDEYEGPIALMKLIRALEPADLTCGMVIAIPALNPPAVDAGTRTSPLDGLNLNRVFPGKPRGRPTERLAHAVTERILPHVDVVLDLHAGGKTHDIVPSVMIHRIANKALMTRTLDVMKAFRAPVGILIKEFESEGMIDTTVERMGKVFGCCELGGLGRVTPETMDVAETGITNVLKHLGMMKGALRTPTWRGRHRSRVLEALDFARYFSAPASGILEPFVDIDDSVVKGQPLGQVHSIRAPRRAPVVIASPADGVLFSRRAFCPVSKGQRIGLVAAVSERW